MMPAHPAKTWAWRVVGVVFAAIVILNAVGSLKDWFEGKRTGVSEGDQCGPAHHWGYVRSGYDMELSCEKDPE